MDFKDAIKQLGERVNKLKEQIETEEATKNAFIMPFIQMLGYDVFNPLEVVPEHTCDIGTKKGEKIDYAIMKDGDPILLIECKHWKQELNLHDNQLLRYFGVSKAKFGLLTNGIDYRFYTDIEEKNVMDSVPFLDVDITNLKDSQIEELKKFHKSYFNESEIVDAAADLKYANEFRTVLQSEISNPSEQFVRVLAKQVYDGQLTAKYIDYFAPIIKKSFSGLINDIINERLKSAIKSESEKEESTKEEKEEPTPNLSQSDIVTTEEELEGFYIIKSILRGQIAAERIVYRDAKTYFAILIDDNNRKSVCRLYFNSETNKQIAFIGEDKKEVKYKLQSLDDIYQYTDQLLKTIEKYIEQ